MYTLRLIDKETNVHENHSLGKRYRVYHKVNMAEAFKNKASIYDIDDPKIFALIESELGDLSHVFENQYAYIMTESGKTFERI